MDIKLKIPESIREHRKKGAQPVLAYLLGLVGVIIIAASAWFQFSDARATQDAAAAQEQGRLVLEQMIEPARSLGKLFEDPMVQELSMAALQGADTGALLDWLQERQPAIQSVQVFSAEAVDSIDPGELGPNGYALLDLVMSVLDGKRSQMQVHRSVQPMALYDGRLIEQDGETVGAVIFAADPSVVIGSFEPEYSALGFVRLSQKNGRQPLTVLKEFGDPALAGEVPEKLLVPGTRFRVEFPQYRYVGVFGESTFLLLIAVGLLSVLAAAGLMFNNRRRKALEPDEETVEHASEIEYEAPEDAALPKQAVTTAEDAGFEDEVSMAAPVVPDGEQKDEEPAEPVPEKVEPESEDVPLMHLKYDITERQREREAEHEPVDLDPGIFRAYDIRGVIDKTLDSGIARKIGQAVGSRVVEDGVGPVVVARDGRLSGPYLMEGVIDGLKSTGCDVLDIGAVPTGVLYYAAHEFASGSGIMITGSHNPPDYNGFKVMVGGETLYGDAITALYERIRDNDLRTGEGRVEQRDVLEDYVKRIADDVKVEKPLRIVLDCGNGIGGVVAPDVIRALGVEVLPLYDEVDGSFPNHHPDPSEPENLEDLIESVRLMDADLGLALDGDADRLGVVTMTGEIIYPDRILMLLSLDVLDRVPGATILFDVKCTAHLPRVISEAGGEPMMYKTGHSLMKAKMKEIGAPFGGEMSGHFFFGERWYGVDDGIYAAARLLEILGGTETPPEAILSALPSSVSTPELKVEMQEGENHSFVEAFRDAASEAARIGGLFEGADVITIDGLRADFKDGWGLVRASNTTPVLVVRFDAESEAALERIKEIFRIQMLELNPDLELPF